MSGSNIPYNWNAQSLSRTRSTKPSMQAHYGSPRSSVGEDDLHGYSNAHAQAAMHRVSPFHPGTIEQSLLSASSTSSLSGAMGQHHVSGHSSSSSPSSDGSRHSLGEVRVDWIGSADLGIPGSSTQGFEMPLDTATAMPTRSLGMATNHYTYYGSPSAMSETAPLPTQDMSPLSFRQQLSNTPQRSNSVGMPVPAHPQSPIVLPPAPYSSPADRHSHSSMSHTSPQSQYGGYPNMYNPPAPTDPSEQQREMARMAARLQEVLAENRYLRNRVELLNNELNVVQAGLSPNFVGGNSMHGGSMLLPSPMNDHGPEFQASWQRRTNARVKRFCALNRAGNALCAWHDSRRERRAHPPRMAPPGMLNCGCTFEQALFEESLARHGVGSYHPGETVRMDPALRNPLLSLLEERYGYRDGDFERDPQTGAWVEGEGHEKWEVALHSSNPKPSSSRK